MSKLKVFSDGHIQDCHAFFLAETKFCLWMHLSRLVAIQPWILFDKFNLFDSSVTDESLNRQKRVRRTYLKPGFSDAIIDQRY